MTHGGIQKSWVNLSLIMEKKTRDDFTKQAWKSWNMSCINPHGVITLLVNRNNVLWLAYYRMLLLKPAFAQYIYRLPENESDGDW